MNTVTPFARPAPANLVAPLAPLAPLAPASVRTLRARFAANPVGEVMHALAEERSHVEFQPCFNLADMQVVGAEALFRMRNAEGARVSPDNFMPLLERSNAIVAVTGFVTRAACASLTRWRALLPDMRVSINVCAEDLNRFDFVDDLVAELDAHGLGVDAVELEVVERTPVQPGSIADRNLRDLAGMGVPVAIDDFGCAYANQERFDAMPASKLKLDRSLVIASRSGEAFDWLAELIQRAHARGMSVVAEGIETEVELVRVRSLGCDIAQGFHLARPESAEALERRLQAGVRH